jgi:hypothetical protein
VWAAFSVVGDPMVVVLLRKPASPVGWWAGVGGVAVILIAVAASWRRRRSPAGEPQVSKR